MESGPIHRITALQIIMTRFSAVLSLFLFTSLALATETSGAATLASDYPHAFDPDPERFRASVEKLTKEGDPLENPIIAVGSSSMRMWGSRINEDLKGLTYKHYGFGGSHFSDVIYFVEELILAEKPRAVLIYEGDNDTAYGKSPSRILHDLQFLVDLCRAHLPDLRFYVISIKPSPARARLWPTIVSEANSLMQKYCEDTEGVTFLNIGPALLNKDGSMRPELCKEDRLHLNDLGYELWAGAIVPALRAQESAYEPKPSGCCTPADASD